MMEGVRANLTGAALLAVLFPPGCHAPKLVRMECAEEIVRGDVVAWVQARNHATRVGLGRIE